MNTENSLNPSPPWILTKSLINAVINNHFKDLLDICGAKLGLLRDNVRPGYNPDGDFTLRLLRLSSELRRFVVRWVTEVLGKDETAVISLEEPANSDIEANIVRTERAMQEGKKAIAFCILGDRDKKLASSYVLLVRRDCLEELFVDDRVGAPSEAEPPSKAEYDFIDVRRVRQSMDRRGIIVMAQRCRVENLVRSRLLGKVQGYEPKECYVIALAKQPNEGARRPRREGGRGTSSTCWSSRVSFRSTLVESNMHNLVVGVHKCGEDPVTDRVAEEAYVWRRKVEEECEAWLEATPRTHRDLLTSLAANTSDPRLRPNMKSPRIKDWPWSLAKKRIAFEIGELTLISSLPFESVKSLTLGRLNNFRSEDCTAGAFERVPSAFVQNVLKFSKPSYDGPPIIYPKIPSYFAWYKKNAARETSMLASGDRCSNEVDDTESHCWQHTTQDTSPFFVDFELALGEHLYGQLEGGRKTFEKQAVILLIGCGRMVNGMWRYCPFTARGVEVRDEFELVCQWIDAMREWSSTPKPRVVFWGAEKAVLSLVRKRIASTVKDYELVELEMCDLQGILQKSEFYAKGILSYGLKEVVKTLEALNVLSGEYGKGREEVETSLSAAALLLAAVEQQSDFKSTPQFERLIRYNEADCRDLARIWEHLMSHRITASSPADSDSSVPNSFREGRGLTDND